MWATGNTRYIRFAAVAVSVVLWSASLFIPAVALQVRGPLGAGTPHMHFRVDVNSGAWMLFFSLGGVIQANFAGVANLLLVIGWLRLAPRGSTRATSVARPSDNAYVAPTATLLRALNVADARILLGIALLMTLETFQLKNSGIPYDEGVVQRGYLLRLLPGWYLWVLSIAIPFLASLLKQSTETFQQSETLG